MELLDLGFRKSIVARRLGVTPVVLRLLLEEELFNLEDTETETETQAEIVSLIRQGKPLRQISGHTGLKESQIRRELKKLGVDLENLSDVARERRERAAAILAKHLEGKEPHEIARELPYSVGQVNYTLSRVLG